MSDAHFALSTILLDIVSMTISSVQILLTSIRYLLVWGYLGEVKSKTYTAVDDPLRDEKRMAALADSIV